jgi:hypothetical protein
MTSKQSPQLGYNHNIPHRGRLYHVQTEDSGIDRAHIFTHVFYDGTIISSNKVDYAGARDEHASGGGGEFDGVVVGLMQESHKSMIRRLRNGEFDAKIVLVIGEHPAESNKAPEAQAIASESADRPERRPAPQPREVEPQGPGLRPGPDGPTVDPSLAHPVFASPEAQAQVAASAAGRGQGRPSRGPGRVQRRALGGIGGQGVRPDAALPLITERRDVIVGAFASDHQADLDEDVLAILREDA